MAELADDQPLTEDDLLTMLRGCNEERELALMALARATALLRRHAHGKPLLTFGAGGLDVINRAETLLAEIDFRYCRACGCSESDACEGGCSWAEADLCSECVGAAHG